MIIRKPMIQQTQKPYEFQRTTDRKGVLQDFSDTQTELKSDRFTNRIGSKKIFFQDSFRIRRENN